MIGRNGINGRSQKLKPRIPYKLTKLCHPSKYRSLFVSKESRVSTFYCFFSLLPILPVREVPLHYFPQGIILEAHHQLDIPHHILHRMVLPHLYPIKPLPHLCVDHEEDFEVVYQSFLPGLFPCVQGERTHLALTAAAVGLETVDPFYLAGFLHADQVLIESCGDHIGIGGYGLCPKPLGVFLLLIDDHVGVVPILSLHGTGLGFQISGLYQFRFGVDFRLELAQFELLLNLLQGLQIFAIGEDIVQAVELMVAILLLSQVLTLISAEQFAIAFDDGLDHFEEGEFLSLFIGQELAVELDELEEDAFDEGLCLLGGSLLIEQGDQAVEDESGGYEIITEVDQFQHSPCIQDGQGAFTYSQQLLMEEGPFLEGVVALLCPTLVLQDDVLQLFLLEALHVGVLLVARLLLLHALKLLSITY